MNRRDWIFFYTMAIFFIGPFTYLMRLHQEARLELIEMAYISPISRPVPSSSRMKLVVASWYGAPYHGRKTASGEIFDKEGMTYAHRTDPFGKWINVSIGNKRIKVRCNDRGPWNFDRDIDLSEGAARKLGITGLAIVNISEIDK